MIVICPGCGKKLKVPDGAAGKKARCPGCSKVVTVPGEPVAAPAPPSAGRASPAETAPATAANAPASGMRCAACKAPGIEALPPNKFSRRPGYVCPGCGAKMRPPGSIGGYVFAIALGGFASLLGLTGLVIGVSAGESGDPRIKGGVMIMILGAAVIS